MPIAASDSLGVADRLERDFGVPETQARGIAHVLHENIVGYVVTKDDITAVRKDLVRIEEKLTDEITRLEEANKHLEKKLTGEIARLEEKMTGENTRPEERLNGKLEGMEARLSAQISRQILIAALSIIGAVFAMIKLTI